MNNKKKLVPKIKPKPKNIRKPILDKKSITNNVRIKQLYVSPSLISFETKFLEKYDMIKYNHKYDPCIFFGMYRDIDYEILSKHLGISIIIFGGSDIFVLVKNKNISKYRKRINLIKFGKNNCVAISNYISNDLTKLGIKHKNIRFNLLNNDIFKPLIKGNSIYIYTNVDQKKTDIYGSSIYNEVIKRLPQYNFIIANCKSYNQTELQKIYKKCFIGMRLTKHDGNANTVQELGLCGIKCIFNGDSPNAIFWRGVDDIINNIIKEEIKINTIDEDLSKKVKMFYDVNNKNPLWLYTKYYI
jgi:hypothetical protein